MIDHSPGFHSASLDGRRPRDTAAAAVNRLGSRPAPRRIETRQFCGKQLVASQGVTAMAIGSEADGLLCAIRDAAGKLLARRVTCAACQAVFCLECGTAIGHQGDAGKTRCPRCGRSVPSTQL
jgi:hypothetical protein